MSPAAECHYCDFKMKTTSAFIPHGERDASYLKEEAALAHQAVNHIDSHSRFLILIGLLPVGLQLLFQEIGLIQKGSEVVVPGMTFHRRTPETGFEDSHIVSVPSQ